MVESIRKDERSVLLLDCGAVFDNQKDTAELILKAMELMGYDALNLGSQEFNFGKEFLEHTRSHVSFPYIASNLVYDGGRLPWTQEYIIKEVGGIKVAILGVLNPDDLAQLPDQEHVKGLEAVPPEAVLKRLLPEVRGKTDLVILLSRFDVEKTRELVQAVKGIDIAISSGGDDMYYTKPLENGVVLQTGSLGKNLGLLKITLDEKRALCVSERKYISLDNSVPGNENIERLVKKFKEDQAKEVAALAKKQEEKTHQALMEGLKLSPQEFMERYRKEQNDKTKGVAQ